MELTWIDGDKINLDDVFGKELTNDFYELNFNKDYKKLKSMVSKREINGYICVFENVFSPFEENKFPNFCLLLKNADYNHLEVISLFGMEEGHLAFVFGAKMFFKFVLTATVRINYKRLPKLSKFISEENNDIFDDGVNIFYEGKSYDNI